MPDKPTYLKLDKNNRLSWASVPSGWLLARKTAFGQAYTDKLDGKMPKDVFLRKVGEWREDSPEILAQIKSRQTANQNYLEEPIKLPGLRQQGLFRISKTARPRKGRLLKIV